MQKTKFIWLAMLLIGWMLTGAGCADRSAKTEPNAEIQNKAIAGPAGSTASIGSEVNIKNFSFTPAAAVIKAGEAVNWIQQDGAPHQIVIPDLAKSAALAKGENFSFVFDRPGRYKYYCGIHPSMNGIIEVK